MAVYPKSGVVLEVPLPGLWDSLEEGWRVNSLGGPAHSAVVLERSWSLGAKRDQTILCPLFQTVRLLLSGSEIHLNLDWDEGLTDTWASGKWTQPSRWGPGESWILFLINEAHLWLQYTCKSHLHAINSLRDYGDEHTVYKVSWKSYRGCKMVKHLSLFCCFLDFVFLRMDELHKI